MKLVPWTLGRDGVVLYLATKINEEAISSGLIGKDLNLESHLIQNEFPQDGIHFHPSAFVMHPSRRLLQLNCYFGLSAYVVQ